jgi:transposase
LRQWYRTLDQLMVQQKPIEKELFLRLRNLFSLNVDLVFYDLTSTYFEGNGPVGFARHGHSRDGKPRNRQVLVGLVMIEGWPIAHHVFHGNLRDSTTVEKVLPDLQARFGLRRVVFVGDRGMVTSGNLDRLRSSGQGYVVGLKRRRQPEILRYLQSATGPWLECPAGISAREKSQVAKTLVQEVASGTELLNLDLVPFRRPHIRESSYVPLDHAERGVSTRIPRRAPHKSLRHTNERSHAGAWKTPRQAAYLTEG